MTIHPHQNQSCPLAPAVLTNMLRATLDALPVSPAAPAEALTIEREAALLAVVALRPRDPMEALLAARCIMANYAVNECFRCAAEAGLPPALMLRYHSRCQALARLADMALKDLMKRQEGLALEPVALPGPMPEPRPAADGGKHPMQRETVSPPKMTAPPHPAGVGRSNVAAEVAARAAAIAAAAAEVRKHPMHREAAPRPGMPEPPHPAVAAPGKVPAGVVAGAAAVTPTHAA